MLSLATAPSSGCDEELLCQNGTNTWQGASWVTLVDAVRSGAPPGTIHRLDARAGPLPGGFLHYSTHAFSVAEAVELARSLGQLPTGDRLRHRRREF